VVARRRFLILFLLPVFLSGSAVWMAGQKSDSDQTVFRVTVDMVQLNVAVIDNKGNYITHLRPSDFAITEDGIPQKIATFEEGNEAPRTLLEIAQGDVKSKPDSAKVSGPPEGLNSAMAGANVFILFDTSDYMYRSFALAQDAIAEFIRTLDGPDRVAFYSFSRDFFRAALLTPDRSTVLRGVRTTIVGDHAALYNALLLTLKDAAKYSGKKVIVVFSNGPDNASTVAPDDVGELAQWEGIPIYMISTSEAKHDPASATVFARMSASTGGEAYFAKNWRDQQLAFRSIQNDLSHLYALGYYPQPNPNRGWRAIKVKLVGERAKKYRIRTRSGYRPKSSRAAAGTTPAP
jgi:Ca-activated chloride channel family protein